MPDLLRTLPAAERQPVTAWTAEDSAAARAEGWDLFDADGEMQIQRLDDAAILHDDIVAWRLVTRRACQGSALHCKALRCASPREVAFIRRVVRPENMPLSI